MTETIKPLSPLVIELWATILRLNLLVETWGNNILMYEGSTENYDPNLLPYVKK